MREEDSIDADDVADVAYRSISPLAVMGLALALLSPLAYFASLLLAVPFVAVAISFAAVRQIDRSSESYTGRWIGLLGLFLSMAVLVTLYSKDAFATGSHDANLDILADRFFEALAEQELEQAHQLTKFLPGRLFDPTSAEAFYAEDEAAKEDFSVFADMPAVVALSLAGPDPVLIEQSGPAKKGYRRLSMTRVYEIERGPQEGDYPGSFPSRIAVVFERSRPIGGSSSWRVDTCQVANPAG